MRRPVVRLIAGRELRDQLRDRRTLFLILGLPALMYPLFVGVAFLFTEAMKGKTHTVGVANAAALPRGPVRPDPSAVAGTAVGVAADFTRPFPPLLVNDDFPPEYAPPPRPDGLNAALAVKLVPAADEELLASRAVDVLVAPDDDFAAKLERGETPAVRVLVRDGDENSKLAARQVTGVLRRWATKLKETRFARSGLPADFDVVIEVRDPQADKTTEKKIADEVRDVLVRVVPFLLVMWVLTGSIYPAIDMTAGEKERGTMETLLISPAGRAEIVAGKFLATTALGFGSALWNVALMAAAVAAAGAFLGVTLVSLGGLAACVLVALPVAMLFAALCLSLGVFARSTKEGNYYMVPLFFAVLPLAYWTMAPGIELDGVTSWVPLTNALLLQQRLMAVRPDPFPWRFVPPVVVSLTACIGLALWAAVAQFKREGVLFREAAGGGGRKRRGERVKG